MTEKRRFDLICDSNQEWLMKAILYLPLRDNNTNKRITLEQCYNLLNELHKENKQLNQEMGDLGAAHAEEIGRIEDEFDEEMLKLEKENEFLKKSIKRQQGSNNECSKLVFDLNDKNQRLKKALKKIKKENRDLKNEVHFYKCFQKNARDLEKENRQLKQEIWDLGTAHAEEVDKTEEEFDKEVSRLVRENKQIKTKINFYKSFQKDTKELEKQNRQLKEQLKDCQQKKQNIKDLLMNSEPVIEQKQLQKLIYRAVNNLIDEKIDELEERYKFGQEVYRGCPMHNIRFGINVLKELKKELPNDRN